MSKVLNQIKYQIKRDGELPEHLEVLKLYNTLIKCNLGTSILWGLLTKSKWEKDQYTISVKPETISLFNKWNLNEKI